MNAQQNDPFGYLYRHPETPEETTSPLDMKEVVQNLGEAPTENLSPVTKELPPIKDDVIAAQATHLTRSQNRVRRVRAWLADWGLVKVLLLPTLAVCGLYLGMLLGAPESLPDFAVPPGIETEAEAKPEPQPSTTTSQKKRDSSAVPPVDTTRQSPVTSARPTSSVSPSASETTSEATASASSSASAAASDPATTALPSPSATPSASLTSAPPSPTVEPTQVPSTTPPATTTEPPSGSPSSPASEQSEEAAPETP